MVDDEPDLRDLLASLLRRAGYDVAVERSGASALRRLESGELPDAVLLDWKMPGVSGLQVLRRIRDLGLPCGVVVLSAHDDPANVVEALRAGADDFLSKGLPPSADELAVRVQRALAAAARERRVESLQEELATLRAGPDLSGYPSLAMRALFARVTRASAVKAPVLITGSTGTGKGVVARAIHQAGPLASGPYLVVNCSAIPESLFESELFGYEAGAFSGANRTKKGKFELASGGTLLLDEVGDLPADVQPKLLTALDEARVTRLGGTVSIATRIRVLAATNRDLEQLVKAGRFREDLFYRLNMLELRIPSLEERSADIPLLAAEVLRSQERDLRMGYEGIEPAALDWLCQRPWPGNMRQLTAVVLRGMLTGAPPLLRLESMMDGAPKPTASFTSSASTIEKLPTLKDSLRTLAVTPTDARSLLSLYCHTRGNYSRMAEVLGWGRNRRRLRQAIDSSFALLGDAVEECHGNLEQIARAWGVPLESFVRALLSGSRVDALLLQRRGRSKSAAAKRALDSFRETLEAISRLKR
ncbi:MAG: sigma-54-dependent Fis family transcriptional regulator [Candidatus Wallbacteria bacterium]|nr:sigma-54-dependent Fis family transcriptional regulator [Candidatus Wallbacteria bacterium]